MHPSLPPLAPMTEGCAPRRAAGPLAALPWSEFMIAPLLGLLVLLS